MIDELSKKHSDKLLDFAIRLRNLRRLALRATTQALDEEDPDPLDLVEATADFTILLEKEYIKLLEELPLYDYNGKGA